MKEMMCKGHRNKILLWLGNGDKCTGPVGASKRQY